MSPTPAPTTRASLLLRLRDAEDREAWVEFVEIYEPAVYRQLRKCGLQDADARELAQEFFIAVHRNIDRWEAGKERGSFRGWLKRVTRNLVINWMKRGQRRTIAWGGDDAQAFFDELAEEASGESQAFDLEMRRAIFHRAAAVVRQEQSPKAWRAFWETAVEGRPPAEVADGLKMSYGAVRVAKCRLLARLKEAVKAIENEYQSNGENES